MFDDLVRVMERRDDRSRDELPMKVVGRKGRPKVNVETIDSMQRMVNDLRGGRGIAPKGVFRFKTFEEADEWSRAMLVKCSARRFGNPESEEILGS